MNALSKSLTMGYLSLLTVMREMLQYAPNPTPASGSSGSASGAAADVVSKITSVKTILVAIIEATGVIFIIIGLLRYLKGTKNGDDRQADQGITILIVGIVMSGFTTLLAIFTS